MINNGKFVFVLFRNNMFKFNKTLRVSLERCDDQLIFHNQQTIKKEEMFEFEDFEITIEEDDFL